jgi:uncharacterized methyltransferase DUF6094
MTRRSFMLGRHTIAADVGLRLGQLLRLPESPFVALAAPCGDGQFLASLMAGSTAIRYGIEPHRPAARQAATHLTRVLVCDAEDARVSHGEVSLLVLGAAASSPGARAARRQRDLGLAPRLRTALPWLRPGGILLALLAPDELTPSTIKLLITRCEAVTAYRLSTCATSALAVAGVKRADAALDRAVCDLLAGARAGRSPLLSSPPLVTYPVPAGRRLSIFRSVVLDPHVLEGEVPSSPVWSAFWQSQLAGRVPRQLRPPLPLHKGHLGLLLAAGECDGIVGEGDDRHLVRGIVRKREIVLTEYDVDGRQTTRTRDVFRVVVKLLFPDGTLRVIGDQAPAVTTESESADTVVDLDEALGVAPAALESADETVEMNALTGRRRRAFDL